MRSSTTRHAQVPTLLSIQHSYLVEARFEVQALAVLVHRPQVPVQGGLVPLGPTALARRAAALEDVLQLLFARAAAEDGLTQGELSSEAPRECNATQGDAGDECQRQGWQRLFTHGFVWLRIIFSGLMQWPVLHLDN